MMRVLWLLYYSLAVAKTIGAEEIPWDEFSEQLGPGILRKIGPAEKVFMECAASIEAYGGAAVPSVANGTCSFAGMCVFEDCGVNKDATAAAAAAGGDDN